MRRYWYVMVGCVIVCSAAAAFLASRESPRYEARAVLQVGRLDVASQAVSGYLEASKSLAQVYSRIATSRVLETQVAKAEQQPLAIVRRDLESTAAPQGTTVTLIAKGDTAEAATQLAAAASVALQRTADQLSTSGRTGGLLRDHREMLGRSYREELAARLAGRRAQRTSSDVTRTRALSDQRKARVRAANYFLQAQAIGAAYTAAQQLVLDRKPLLVLDAGREATPNTTAIRQRFLLVGLIAGLLMGGALIALLNTRHDRRSTASLQPVATWPHR
jgi:hypothetical protein